MGCEECQPLHYYPGRMTHTRDGRCIRCKMPVFLPHDKVIEEKEMMPCYVKNVAQMPQLENEIKW